jgi:hypothetical protein
MGPRRTLVILLAVAGATLLVAGLLAACGNAGGAVDQAPTIAGQSPIDTYGDTQDAGVAPATTAAPEAASDGATKAELARVRVVSVGLGAEGGYIGVMFKAPPKLARRWQSGMVYVVDERTHKVYSQIPKVPVLGVLFGRPQSAGQTGYVMLYNIPPVKAGAKVTVVLGSYTKKHVKVR